MPDRVDVAPRMLQWARRRSGLEVADLITKFSKLPEWEAGVASPTMRQLERYASATHTPVGFLFLREPPQEVLPIPDFRTFSGRPVLTPTPDLLDTIYSCEQRQDWYRSYAEAHGFESVALVGSLTTRVNPVAAAAQLREALGFDLARRAEFSNWTEALSGLVVHAEDAGVLVMINGVVGTNTHRKLNPREFRGFALVDPFAPVVFINGADTKAAQIFTLTHELAHIALGQSALSLADLAVVDTDNAVETWCNQVAAELLVPLASIADDFDGEADLTEELDRLARKYRVSTLVVLRRVFDAQRLTLAGFRTAYSLELERVLGFAARTSDGGSFYNTQPVRISKTFARAVISDTTEGRTLFRDALRLLGSKKISAFEQLSERLGVA